MRVKTLLATTQKTIITTASTIFNICFSVVFIVIHRFKQILNSLVVGVISDNVFILAFGAAAVVHLAKSHNNGGHSFQYVTIINMLDIQFLFNFY